MTVPIVLFAWQALVYHTAGINAGWDVSFVEDAATLSVRELQANEFLTVYFSHYPNNLFLLWVFRCIEALRQSALPSVSPYSMFAYVSCTSVSLSCGLFMKVVPRLLRSRGIRVVAVSLFVLLVGMSPWFMIPYSDTFGLLACMAMLWCHACGRTRWTRWMLLGALAAVGYALKPTAIFAFVALVVASALTRAWRAETLRSAGASAVCAACGLALGLALTGAASSSVGLKLDANARFTATHYAMLGLNAERQGVYSDEDFVFSAEAPSVEERQRRNLDVFRARLGNLGPRGLSRLMVQKLLNAFNDGTFAWSAEGGFCRDSRAGEGFLSSALRNFYYYGEPGYAWFCTIQQALWLITLLGMPMGLLGMRGGGGGLDARTLALVAAMLASVTALALFLLVFEVRARYLYLYGGYFVLLSAWGYEQLAGVVSRRVPPPSEARG